MNRSEKLIVFYWRRNITSSLRNVDYRYIWYEGLVPCVKLKRHTIESCKYKKFTFKCCQWLQGNKCTCIFLMLNMVLWRLVLWLNANRSKEWFCSQIWWMHASHCHRTHRGLIRYHRRKSAVVSIIWTFQENVLSSCFTENSGVKEARITKVFGYW